MAQKIEKKLIFIKPYLNTPLCTLLDNYDIFNGDNFDFFYQDFPGKTFHLKGKKWTGVKHSKTWLIGVADSCTENFPMFTLINFRNKDISQESDT